MKKNTKRNRKKNSGITLIALVITVIVMLILAGVAISVLTNDGGLFDKTIAAADKYKESAQNEADQLTTLMNEIDGYISGMSVTPNEPEDVIDPNNPLIIIPAVDTDKYPTSTWNNNVNTPQLKGTGLIPVKFDSDGTPIVVTPEEAATTSWYNYTAQTGATTNGGTSQWANAVTRNDKGEVTGYWVWIPRYEYKINSNKTIDINFISTDTTTPSTSEYIIHPAFTNEKSKGYPNGGWKAEVPGFWVAKFEAGYAGKGKSDANNKVTIVDSGLTYTGTTASSNYYGSISSGSTQMKLPVFLPKTFSYNYINVGDCFNLSRVIQDKSSYYGLSNTKVDSHMMKNSEWGAVAYLTHSKYGRNGTEVTINNLNMNGKVSTIYPITGYAGGTVSASKNDLSSAPTSLDSILNTNSHAWNTKNGVLASSTGNMYGVYDMSGGSWEYVAGYVPVQDSGKYINKYGGTFAKISNDNIRTTSTEYASVYAISNTGSDRNTNYTANSGRKGEALNETSTSGTNSTSWNSDCSDFPYSTYPFFKRCGACVSESLVGAFAFCNSYGTVYNNNSFRAVLFPL